MGERKDLKSKSDSHEHQIVEVFSQPTERCQSLVDQFEDPLVEFHDGGKEAQLFFDMISLEIHSCMWKIGTRSDRVLPDRPLRAIQGELA